MILDSFWVSKTWVLFALLEISGQRLVAIKGFVPLNIVIDMNLHNELFGLFGCIILRLQCLRPVQGLHSAHRHQCRSVQIVVLKSISNKETELQVYSNP